MIRYHPPPWRPMTSRTVSVADRNRTCSPAGLSAGKTGKEFHERTVKDKNVVKSAEGADGDVSAHGGPVGNAPRLTCYPGVSGQGAVA